MNFTSSVDDGIMVFSLMETKLDTGNSGSLKTELTRALTENRNHSGLILHLPEIENCDSSGLSVLLVANRLAVEKNSSFRIVAKSPKVLNLIKITRLDEVLIVAESVEKAKQQIKGF